MKRSIFYAIYTAIITVYTFCIIRSYYLGSLLDSMELFSTPTVLERIGKRKFDGFGKRQLGFISILTIAGTALGFFSVYILILLIIR